jgi:hypothetical protein
MSEEHAEKHPGKPFLEYLAFTAPHFPLQATAEDIAPCAVGVADCPAAYTLYWVFSTSGPKGNYIATLTRRGNIR